MGGQPSVEPSQSAAIKWEASIPSPVELRAHQDAPTRSPSHRLQSTGAAGRIEQRRSGSWQGRVVTLPATSRPSRRARKSCLSAAYERQVSGGEFQPLFGPTRPPTVAHERPLCSHSMMLGSCRARSTQAKRWRGRSASRCDRRSLGPYQQQHCSDARPSDCCA